MSMYTTAQLLAANEQKFKFDPLFLRLFFRESYPFTTEKVYLSQIPGLVNMALYVSPIVSGEVIRSRGGSTSEFTPGYVKPKHEVNPQMTLRRLPDEDPQNLADPAYRRRRIIMQNMRDEELAIAQVEEMQAVSAVLKGKYTMTGEAFDPVEVDMGRSEENNITQSGGTEWSKRDKSTYDPTDDIEAYALNASGVVNIIVFDPKGWALCRVPHCVAFCCPTVFFSCHPPIFRPALQQSAAALRSDQKYPGYSGSERHREAVHPLPASV